MAKATAIEERLSAAVLRIVEGPEKGHTYTVSDSGLRIGRGADNDVVLASASVSRNHAVIEVSGSSYIVRDMGSKNGVLVNQQLVEQCELKNNDSVQIGEFQFRFSVPSVETEVGALVDPEEGEDAQLEAFSIPAEEKPKPKKGRQSIFANKRVLLYGGVGLVVVMLLMFGQSKDDKKTENKDATVEKGQIDFPIRPDEKAAGAKAKPPEIRDPVLKQAEEDLGKLDWKNNPLLEAEQYFRRGQREYLSKNYHSAIQSFQAALSFDRGHELANKYYLRTVQEVDQKAQAHWNLATQYFTSLQYSRAIYHYKETIALLAHRPTDPRIERAQQNIKISEEKLKASGLFP